MDYFNWKNNLFGVASKIIAMYFKVSIIIPAKDPKNVRLKIYPPIDSINLKQLGLNGVRCK